MYFQFLVKREFLLNGCNKKRFYFISIMTPKMTWFYIAGLLETDGSLSLALTTKGYYLVTISISSQTKHTGLLELLSSFFLFFRISLNHKVLKRGQSNEWPSRKYRKKIQHLLL